MYTSRLKDGRKKDKDATTNLFTRLLYYQQQGSGCPVARGQPKGRRASQSHIMAGPVGQP